MYKVFFKTFGCKVSYYETECMKSVFRNAGYEISDSSETADVIVVNSCTVTSSGDSRTLSALRKLRSENPSAVIALTGCYPQAFSEEASKVTTADIITGTKNRGELLWLVEEFMSKRQHIVQIPEYSSGDSYESLTCTQFDDNTRAFVKIQDGCNQFCSYCIIPYARGRCRSKPVEVLKNEAALIAQSGKREIVLSGINLAFFGRDTGSDLAEAAKICAGTEGIDRVRLGSLEPEMMSDSLLDRLAALPELCPQFHLSLQSGCTETLRAMNRKYTAEDFLLLTKRIRERFPDCAFTTDIMVGFPGETEENFAESLEFVQKIGFSKMHVFRYSRRRGTVADRMKNQIPESVKSQRWHRMNDAASGMRAEYLRGLSGRTVPVLFERENCTDFHHGYAPDYTLVKIPCENPKKSLRNEIFCVKIEESEPDCCIGRIIGEAL